jgi:acyl-CoA dehydrogenase
MYALGAAQSLLTDTVEYAKTRRQFGVAIGSFQAIKHSLADASIELRHARSLVAGGLRELDDATPSAVSTVAMGKDKAGRATQSAAGRCLQVFGGIGFTWEHKTHAFLKTVVRLRHYPEAAGVLRTELLHASE